LPEKFARHLKNARTIPADDLFKSALIAQTGVRDQLLIGSLVDVCCQRSPRQVGA
jgi:hypothetical protein